MNNNRIAEKYWLGVLLHFVVDALAFGLAFAIGVELVLGYNVAHKLERYSSAIAVGAFALPCVIYVLGLYSQHSHGQKVFVRTLLLLLAFGVAMLPMLAVFYLNRSSMIGRGVLAWSFPIAFFTVLLHHLYLLHQFRNYRERVALIITSEEDERESLLVEDFGKHHLKIVGIIPYADFKPNGHLPVLGHIGELPAIVARENIERVICTNKSIVDPTMCSRFCQLRYSGVTVMPLIALFEEMAQCVPIDLVTPEWLLSASGAPQMLYLKKVKRAFDIITALLGLLLGWPLLIAGMAWVKWQSPEGSVIFRQRRCGRFGKTFEVLKLRSMRVNAESPDTAVWAQANDPRAIRGGNFLRKYRIDELPQLWNVLRGEMSFVGPRPERPEFIAELARQIPYYQERVLVQPGITGWAQVNYPYGASVEDARHKLEYDLYYAKNMSVFLDIFILLDTVRIILLGGSKKRDRLAARRPTGDTTHFVATAPKVRQP
ncbi:MAG: hypothetical protein RLZZ350_2010 [Verrucomicrobiota bacterium]|jgi:exopolysaccharide biosynthesis polyprenyl glycosylphosphotransferase